jgi:hypothetical protein
MTKMNITCTHRPAIVHRTGGPSASESNTCMYCGKDIKLSTGTSLDSVYGRAWVEMTREDLEKVKKEEA